MLKIDVLDTIVETKKVELFENVFSLKSRQPTETISDILRIIPA